MVSSAKAQVGSARVDRRWRVLVATSVPVFMTLIDVTIVNVALPDMRRTFHASSLADLSWVFNAYNVLFAAALVPAGRLADRFGRRRLFYIGVLTFLAASVVCGLAWSLPVLIVARAGQAVGGAIIVPTSLGLILPEFPPKLRATATALWTAAGALASIVGPPLGGVLVHLVGWRWIFFVNLLIGIPALGFTVGLLRESREPRGAGVPDILGVVAVAGAFGGFALALIKGPDWGWASSGVLTAFGASVLLFALFAARSIKHTSPVVDLPLFRIRSFFVSNLGALGFGVAFYALLLSTVLFLTGVWRYSSLDAGLALMVPPVMATAAAPFAGRFADRYGPRAVAVPGCLLFAAGGALMLVALGAEPGYWTVFMPAAVLTGLGVGFTLPSFNSATVAELPDTQYASGIAIASCFRHIGGMLGVSGVVAVLGGQRLPTAGGFSGVWALITIAALAAAVAAVALGRTGASSTPSRRISRP